jgi:hypothetical protein
VSERVAIYCENVLRTDEMGRALRAPAPYSHRFGAQVDESN